MAGAESGPLRGRIRDRVGKRGRQILGDLKQPWLLALLFVACIPVFPEYFAPPLAGASLLAAHFDAKRNGRRIMVGVLGKIMLAYMAYMAFGLLYTPDFFSTLATLGMWAVMFLGYLSVVTVLTDRQRYDTALFCLCLVAGLIGAIGCIQYVLRAFLGWDLTLQFWRFADQVVFEWLPIDFLPITTDLRVSSTFNNPNIFAESLIMVFPFVSYYAFSGRRTGTRTLCRFCLLAAAGGVAFSFSRGCYLALLVIALIFCIANIRKILLMIVTAASALLLVPESVMARLFSVTGMDASTNERLRIWEIAVETIGRDPLFGLGGGIFNSWDTLVHNGINAPHMHNIVLELLVEGGVIALGIMLFAGWKLLRGGLDMLQHSRDSRMMGVVFLAFTAGFCLDGMVDFPLFTPKLVGLFLLVLGLGDAAMKLYLDRELQPLREAAPFALLLRRLHRLRRPKKASENAAGE
ncbi:MAG TPA: O-antigen ligase family protein [Firmicutes bacterium]|nr:O-antigen ligase family protein [Bacillota bacterium]